MTNLPYLIERIYRAEWNNPSLTFHDILRVMYIDKNMSMKDMADEMGIASGCVYNYLKKEGIQREIKCKR